MHPPTTEHEHSSSIADSDATEQALYAKREKIYPREVHGYFATLRLTAIVILLSLYFIQPWIELDGRQIVLFDLPERKFYVYWLIFWPKDFLLLAFLLIIAALSLFFFTALAGRLWCGYACPQTVWTEIYLWVERKIEGSRNKQIKMDKEGLSNRKLLIKFSKHFIWLLIALVTGFTYVAYFTPAYELLNKSFTLTLHPWEAFWIAFFTFSTYANAGWMREQVCKYMCPYARFQSAMFDSDSLIVSYDTNRGDPRGSRKPGSNYKSEGLGDCINCTMCVQVCPTGIDIREGLQYECISCSACIDVCDDVMKKMNYPTGLIRYTTQNLIEGKASRILRPRIFIYGFLLVVFISLFVYIVVSRSTIDLDIIRDRNQLYRETAGLIENIYTLKLINMDEKAQEFIVTAAGIEDMQLLIDKDTILVEGGTVFDLPVRVRADEENLGRRSTEFQFTLSVKDDSNKTITQKAKFLGPIQ